MVSITSQLLYLGNYCIFQFINGSSHLFCNFAAFIAITVIFSELIITDKNDISSDKIQFTDLHFSFQS